MAKTSPAQFIREVRQELAKVTWPTRKETVATTLSVLAMSALAALFFFVVDQVIAYGVQLDPGTGGVMSQPRWFIIHVYSGFEKKVKESISEQAEQKGLGHLFEDILVPMEEVVEVRRGKKVSAERKFFPGYVLVRMVAQRRDLVAGAQHRQGDRLSGPGRQAVADPGPRGRADPQPDGRRASSTPSRTIAFISGDNVRVSDGPFASFSGVVEEVDEAKGRLKVSVSIFGRADPGRAGVLAGREALAASVYQRAGAPCAARMDR